MIKFKSSQLGLTLPLGPSNENWKKKIFPTVNCALILEKILQLLFCPIKT
jgi:hypothetical protein